MQTTRETPGEAAGVTAQLVRFVMTGGFVTALGIGVYALVAIGLRWNPQLGNFLAYAVAVASGYVLHSRWSFRGHGKAEESIQTRGRFVLVQSGGLVLNMAFTWLLTGPMNGPTWWPLVPAVVVTPLLGFVLNRKWVFG